MTGAEALSYPVDAPGPVESAATRSERLAAWVAEVTGTLDRDRDRLAAAWSGPAALSCRQELRLVTGLAGSVVGPLHASGRRLRAHAVVLQEARARVDALRREYDAARDRHRRETEAYAAAELPGPLRRLQLEDQQAAHAAELAGLHARHREVLAEVRASAVRTARGLEAVAAQVLPASARHRLPLEEREADLVAMLPLLLAARQAAGVASAPPSGTPPALVRAWWMVLTADEQDRALRRAADRLGGLAGLPAAVRSRANEHRLATDIASLRTRGVLTEEEQRWLDTCLVTRRALARVRQERGPATRPRLVAQLLVFEPRAFGGEGRVAVAVGDLDTADHVALLVPGLGADVRRSLAGLTEDAIRVVTEAGRQAPGAATATVVWIGYDAPRLGDVAGDGAAEAGADLLAGDVLAVQAARDVMPHLTLVGHSYGSTTAGTALRDHVTGTDDAVLVGSPGPNVATARELQVPDGHVFVGASSRDPVSYLDRFGTDPTHEDFGGYRFRAEDVTRHPFRLDGADHAKYFHADTESLVNIVRIVVGDHGAVERAPYRHEAWLLPDGINQDPESGRAPTVP